jgi:hypothetical protein
MGLRLKIKGAEEIFLDEHSIIKASFMTDTPDDSNARSTDVVNTLRIHGKILTAVNGQPVDDTMKIGKWSLVRAEVADSYREAELEVIVAGKIVRRVNFPEAFIVDYTEDYADVEGTGTFDLTIRQKKDLFDNTEITGGYEA